MHSTPLLLRCLLVLSAGLGVLPAQQSDLPAGVARGSLRQHAGVARDGDAVVGVGADYRAVFDRGGLEFTPAFGDAAPHSLPLRLELRSVARGGRSTPLAPAGEAIVDGTSLRFGRGDLDERFEVRPEGVEHSLLFASRPAGDGDLVVGLAVTTGLSAATCADGTVRFWREGLGGVTVGHVTGIDADGARVRGTLRLADGRLEYVLPSAFVDAAAYPLLLDPVIGAQFVLGAADDLEGDVAYDPGSDCYLAVWKRRLAATDHDIVGVRLDAAGNVLGSTLLFETASSIVSSRPCVAPVRIRNAFAVVWQQGSGPFGPFDLRTRSVEGSTGALSSAVTVVGSADDESEPCISGEVTTVDDDVLVAWRTPVGIQAMQLTVPASLLPAPSSIVALTASPFASRPAFSKTGGTLGQHLVVWQEENLIGDTQIRGRVVTRNLTLLTGVTTFTSSARHKSNPRCDGDGTTFMIVYEREEVSGTGRRDVHARRIGYAAGATTNLTAEVAVEATGLQDETAPDIAWLGARWCVALQERQSGLDDDVVVWMLCDDITACSARTVLTGLDPQPSYRREFQPRLANRYVGLEVHDEAMLVFTEAEDGPPFAANVLAQRLDAIGVPAPVPYGSGCNGQAGTALSLAADNTPWIGYTFSATCNGMSAASPIKLSIWGFSTAAIPITGILGAGPGCLLLHTAEVSEPAVAASTSHSAWLAIPASPALAGTVLYLQVGELDLSLANFATSNGLALTIGG